MDDNYLIHYGIRGMKWGVRRTPEQLGHFVSRTSKEASSQFGNSVRNQVSQRAARRIINGKNTKKQPISKEAKAILRIAATAALTTIISKSAESITSIAYEQAKNAGKAIYDQIINDRSAGFNSIAKGGISFNEWKDLLKMDGLI